MYQTSRISRTALTLLAVVSIRDSAGQDQGLTQTERIEQFRLSAPSAGAAQTILGVHATHYFAYPAKEDPDGEPLLDVNSQPLGPRVSRHDWCLGSIEGTIVVDGEPYNHALSKGSPASFCSGVKAKGMSDARYVRACGPVGDGITLPGKSRPLVLIPFRTIATDPKILPTGSVVFIPAAVGKLLPNGFHHDGYFFAGDIGSAIGGKHIDVFYGTLDQEIFSFVDSDDTFSMRVIPDIELKAEFEKYHLPACTH